METDTQIAPRAPSPVLDLAQALAPIGGAATGEQAARLRGLAEDAWNGMAEEQRAKLAKRIERVADATRGRPLDTARARVAVEYLIALADEGGHAGRAARRLGSPLRELYNDVSSATDRVPILGAIEELMRRRQQVRMVRTAEGMLDGALEGEEVPKEQAKLAPFVLERLAREAWAPDRGGRADQQQVKGAPAQVLINIQSGSAFNSCSTVLQNTDAEVVSV